MTEFDCFARTCPVETEAKESFWVGPEPGIQLRNYDVDM